MLSPKKLLENARNRIAKRENWAQGQLATTAVGSPVSATSPDACKWCSIGAIAAEAGTGLDKITCLGGEVLDSTYGYTGAPPEYNDALRALRRSYKELFPTLPYDSIAWFNDEHGGTVGHEGVLKAFDHAIDSLRGE